jgi:aarF domain-containing kinase
VDNGVDVLSRQILRRALSEAVVTLTPPRPPSIPFLGDIFPPAPALDEIRLPLLLPIVGENGQNRPTVSLLSLKDFTDLLAPKLSQDEEVFAISLADFIGGEIGALLKGDRVLSAQSGDLILRALRSGVLGRSDLLDTNSDAARSVLQFIENFLNVFRRRSSSQASELESEMYEAINALTESERMDLDEIVNELTQRSIRRAVTRLSKVERLL